MPPRNTDAEREVLTAIFADHEQLAAVSDVISGGDFYDHAHRTIFSAMFNMATDGAPMDAVTLAQRLSAAGELANVGGPERIATLLNPTNAGHPSHAPYLAAIVREQADRRRLIESAHAAIEAAHDPMAELSSTLTNHEVAIEALKTGSAANGRFAIEAMTSADLDAADCGIDYLVDGLLVRGQPGGIFGSKKSLKTTISIYLGMCVSEGLAVFDRFESTRATVGIISGESGQATIAETARRQAVAMGRELASFGNVHWAFDLPNLGDAEHILALDRFIDHHNIDLLICDPSYLMLPLGGDAGNLFSVGAFLKTLTELGQRHGAAILLNHHTRKNKADEYQPIELEDIAWSGFQEWARQWILVGRRAKYDPDNGGHHALWLNAGGSAGHSSLWALDVNEGTRQDDGGRRWEYELKGSSEARDEATRAIEEKRRETRNRQYEIDRSRILKVVARNPKGETKTAIRDAAGVRSAAFNVVLADLLEEQTVVRCEITKNNHRTYEGFRLLKNRNGIHQDATGQSGCPAAIEQQQDTPPLGGVRCPAGSSRLSGAVGDDEFCPDAN